MKPISFWRWALLLMALPVCASENLLPDGGFEQGEWKFTRWDRGLGQTDFSAAARTGTKAAHFLGQNNSTAPINLICHSPAIAIEADKEYQLTLWYRSEQGAGASVSLITYREPWNKAQWKTPSTAYITKPLPTTTTWTPYSYRFRAAPGTVQAVAFVRCTGIGNVWFDDVALRSAGQFTLKVLDAGTVQELPSRRSLAFALAGDALAGGWKFFLRETTGGKTIYEKIGTKLPAQVKIQATIPDGLTMQGVLESQESSAILATQSFTIPSILNFAILSPGYRDSLYLSAHPQEIHARLVCQGDFFVRKKLKFALTLDGKEVSAWKRPEITNDLHIPLQLNPGATQVNLALKIQGLSTVSEIIAPLKVVPPAAAGTEVIIGDNNQTLVNGKPFFPAGFYGMPSGAKADAVASAGYTAALTYASEPEACKKWLDDCQRLGLLGMVSIPRPFVSRFDEAKLRAAIRLVKQHPALLGYYLFDEPHAYKKGEMVEDLKRVYDVVAHEDPYHPVGVCICVPEYFGTYESCYDMVMPDPYPLVKNLRPMAYVSDWIETARTAIADRKPIWTVPQAFGWDIIEKIPDPEKYRTPTPQQERCMTYLALVHGSKAILYYCYHVYTGYDAEKKKNGGHPYILGGYLPEQQPKLWGALAQLGEEMKQLGPALLGADAIQGVDGSVHWRWIKPTGSGKGWLIAVNADAQTNSTAMVIVPSLKEITAKVQFGDGTVSPRKNGFLLSLPPLGTLAAKVGVQ